MGRRDDIIIENTIYHTIDKLPFIGNLLQLLNIKYNNQIPTAGIGYNNKAKNFEMVINKDFFAKLSTTQRSAVFQHEVYHVLFKHLTSVHHTRYMASQEESTKWNVAMDLSINQYIEGLPDFVMTLDKFKTKTGKDLEKERAFEYYYEEIDWDKAKKDFGYKPNPNCPVHSVNRNPVNTSGEEQQGQGMPGGAQQGNGQSGEGQHGTGGDGQSGEQQSQDNSSSQGQGLPQHTHHPKAGGQCTCKGGLFPLDDHNIMNDSAGNASEEEIMKAMGDLLKRTQQKTQYGYSQAPKFVQDLINEINKKLSQIDYKRILAKAIRKSLPADDRQGTWFRPSKRYGYQAPGTKNSEAPRVDILLDTSGSISVEEINNFLGEVDAILKTTKSWAMVHLFHTSLYKSVKFKRGFGINELDGVQSGGTDLQDAFNKMMKTKTDCVIVLTDGYYGDIELKGKPHFNTVFAISKGGQTSHPLKRLGQTVSIV